MSPRTWFGGAAIVVSISAGALAAQWSSHDVQSSSRPLTRAVSHATLSTETAVSTYGRLPLSFEANHGQLDDRVKFLTRGAGYALFLTPAHAVLALERTGARAQRVTRAVIGIDFVGADASSRAEGVSPLPGRANYFLGNDPRQWRTNIPTYSEVEFHDIYPGIDLVYYGHQRQLEHDFIVAAGGDPDLITLELTGATSLSLDQQGDLRLQLDGGSVTLERPVIYQVRDGVRHEIAGGYVRKGSHGVGFRVGAYDETQPLVIDPVLTYSTYLRGTGSEEGYAIAVDSTGAYVSGRTASNDFPVTADGFQTSPGGAPNAFVAKLNPEGTGLIYATYLGGGGEDWARGIAVDGSGSVYVTGETASTDFPITAGAFQTAAASGTTGNSHDAFVTKLNPLGSALVYSTYLGGPAMPALAGSGDDIGRGIAVDAAGAAYVTGVTLSSGFPVTTGAYQTTGGSTTSLVSSPFLTKINADGSGLVYSTYLGGSVGAGLAVDGSGAAYVTGSAGPGLATTPNAFQPQAGGGADAFVTKVNAAGSALIYSTYLGGSQADNGNGVAVDSSGAAYVTGKTSAFSGPANFPVTSGAVQTAFGGGDSDAFIAKVNATGTALVYSTYLGGAAADEGTGIAVDSSGFVDVAGKTRSSDFPTSADAAQAALAVPGGEHDGFVARLNQAGTAIDYGTYLGGTADDVANGIAVDAAGSIYVIGTTFSSDFPVTPNAFQTTANGFGTSSAFVSKFAGTSDPGTLTSLISSLLSAGCIDSSRVANALTREVTAAQRAIDSARARRAGRILDALRREVQTQAGKHIGTSCTSEGVTSNPVEVLLAEIQKLADSL